jgi:hypothetical protein
LKEFHLEKEKVENRSEEGILDRYEYEYTVKKEQLNIEW